MYTFAAEMEKLFHLILCYIASHVLIFLGVDLICLLCSLPFPFNSYFCFRLPVDGFPDIAFSHPFFLCSSGTPNRPSVARLPQCEAHPKYAEGSQYRPWLESCERETTKQSTLHIQVVVIVIIVVASVKSKCVSLIH